MFRFCFKCARTKNNGGYDAPSRDAESARPRSMSPLASLNTSRQTVDLWSPAAADPLSVLVLFFLHNGGRPRPGLSSSPMRLRRPHESANDPQPDGWLGRVPLTLFYPLAAAPSFILMQSLQSPLQLHSALSESSKV